MLLQFLVCQGAAGNVFLADCNNAVGVLQVIKAVDLAGVTFSGDQNQLVGDQNGGIGAGELAQLLSLVHVLGVCSDKHVGGCTLLDLGDELCGALVDEGDVDTGVSCLVGLLQVSTRVVQGCCGEDLNLARGCLRSCGYRSGRRGRGLGRTTTGQSQGCSSQRAESGERRLHESIFSLN